MKEADRLLLHTEQLPMQCAMGIYSNHTYCTDECPDLCDDLATLERVIRRKEKKTGKKDKHQTGRRLKMFENIRYDQRYESLLTVYQFCSYTQAAGKLALTPSAVSQQIHSVEREIGAKLFARNGKYLTPTPECLLVVDYVRKIRSVCRQMSEEIDLSRRHLDRISVGITPSAEHYALTDILAVVSGAADKVQVKATTGSADELCRKLKNYEIDLAIIEGACNTEEFNSVIADTDHLVVAVPKDSVWAKKGIITIPQLLEEKLILRPTSSGTRTLFESCLKSSGISPDKLHVIMEAENIDTIIRLVSMGYGLSVLSRRACMSYVERGKIAVVNPEGINMSRTIRILYRPGEDLQDIMGAIRSYYRPALESAGNRQHSENKENRTTK